MGEFYSRLSYSFGNEDWKTEQEALQLQPKNRVLCVTASGDRPLNLLYTECGEVVSIDANPIQNTLLELKKVALANLNYEDYLAFLGITACEDRQKLFERIQGKLSPESVSFWTDNIEMILKGIIFQGAVEKLIITASRIIRALRGKKVDRLFSCSTIEEQKEFSEKHWHNHAWKKTFHLCLHPAVSKIFIKDPGLYEHVDTSIHIGNYICERVQRGMKHISVKECPITSLLFKGELYEESFPPYLTREGTEKIRPRLTNLSFQTSDLLTYLKSVPPNSFDAFSLSDVISYVNKKDFEEIVTALFHAARPGARFCMRELLTWHKLPEALLKHFIREPDLEQKLEKEDRCFVYRFIVGSIVKDAALNAS